MVLVKVVGSRKPAGHGGSVRTRKVEHNEVDMFNGKGGGAEEGCGSCNGVWVLLTVAFE